MLLTAKEAARKVRRGLSPHGTFWKWVDAYKIPYKIEVVGGKARKLFRSEDIDNYLDNGFVNNAEVTCDGKTFNRVARAKRISIIREVAAEIRATRSDRRTKNIDRKIRKGGKRIRRINESESGSFRAFAN
jgi:hypothetical protein